VEVVPYLANVLPQSSSVTRSLALGILRPRAGQRYAPYSGDFIACLSDSNAMVRADAFWILAQIGPAASNAVPQLLQILANTNKLIDATAAYAVWKITQRTNESVPALRRHFEKLAARNQARLGNYTAIDWLLEMEPNSPPVIDYYRNWLKEANTRSRIEACAHIANRRGDASALLPDLWKLMDDPDPKVKQAALNAISAVEPKTHANQSVDSP
jgi:HEAT repeat protein